ncbi:GNVR domain-containing protein, partial [Zestomonas carbonaria]|uniref:GNVR domain-containing protein n=1 Tax=Zestomonas carbonaria TaxID=2762745 RepID=UPI002E285DD6
RIAEIEKELRLLSTNRTVESLRNRTDEDLFLKKLAQWREEAAQLKQLNLDIGRVRLVTVDQVAIEPTKAEKPRKALILALGLVLGGMLGLFVALVRGMLRRLTPR